MRLSVSVGGNNNIKFDGSRCEMQPFSKRVAGELFFTYFAHSVAPVSILSVL